MTNDKVNQLLELLEDEPDDSSMRFLLAREYIKTGKYQHAENQLREVISLDPDYTAAYRQLGDALKLQNKIDDAIVVYYNGITIAEKTRDLQTGKECRAFLKKLGENPPEIS